MTKLKPQFSPTHPELPPKRRRRRAGTRDVLPRRAAFRLRLEPPPLGAFDAIQIPGRRHAVVADLVADR
ncbi:MAG: hypothetical protein MPJ22_02835, partial [Pirellulales bacterium]|nr:hypothetical protein [Pirellulales bacterium]